MTYSSLLTDMRSYLERGYVSDPIVYEQLPRLVDLAQRRISRELKVQGFERVLLTNLTQSVNAVQKPDRWRETISISIGTGANNNTFKPLFVREPEYIWMIYPDSTAEGTPEYYADYNLNFWLIGPTPDAAYPMRVIYYELPPILDDNNQTNYLTEYAPNLLLYAALLEATPYLKNDERIGVWQQMYDRAALALNGEELRKILDRTTVRKE